MLNWSFFKKFFKNFFKKFWKKFQAIDLTQKVFRSLSQSRALEGFPKLFPKSSKFQIFEKFEKSWKIGSTRGQKSLCCRYFEKSFRKISTRMAFFAKLVSTWRKMPFLLIFFENFFRNIDSKGFLTEDVAIIAQTALNWRSKGILFSKKKVVNFQKNFILKIFALLTPWNFQVATLRRVLLCAALFVRLFKSLVRPSKKRPKKWSIFGSFLVQKVKKVVSRSLVNVKFTLVRHFELKCLTSVNFTFTRLRLATFFTFWAKNDQKCSKVTY